MTANVYLSILHVSDVTRGGQSFLSESPALREETGARLCLLEISLGGRRQEARWGQGNFGEVDM